MTPLTPASFTFQLLDDKGVARDALSTGKPAPIEDKIRVDWNFRPGAIFGDEVRKDNPGSSWLIGFLGLEKKPKPTAASLCNLSVRLKKESPNEGRTE